MGSRLALIIGNTEYADPGLAKLTAPGRDAEDFARILRDPNACAFDDVRILLNQVSSSVLEAIDEFFDQRKPDDLLLLYYSGHGMRDEAGSLYLAFKNTVRSRLRSTAVKSDYIREVMDQSRSKRQVLILDCCNSGAFPQGTKADVGGPMGMMTAFQGYGRYVLTASDATQFAWEGDQVIGNTDNSLFTHFLVKGLEGEADHDSDGTITVDELYDYAYEQISRVTPRQTPTKSAAKQEGDIVLRQITRIEDIRPVSLPDELVDAVADSRTFVREGAVQQLEKLLKGKNLGLVRSARATLEKMAAEDDSYRVRQAATQALQPIQDAEKQADEQRKADEAVQRQATPALQQEGLGAERAEAGRRIRGNAGAERKAKVEAEQLKAGPGAEDGRSATAKPEAERAAAAQPPALPYAGARPQGGYAAAQNGMAPGRTDIGPQSVAQQAAIRSILPRSPWLLAGMAGAIIVLGIATILAVRAILSWPIPTKPATPTQPPSTVGAATPTQAFPTVGPAASLPFTTSFEDLKLNDPARIDPLASIDGSISIEPFSNSFASYTPWRVDARAHTGKIAINVIPFGNSVEDGTRILGGAILEPLFMTAPYKTVVLKFWKNTTSNPRPASIHNCDSSLNVIYRIDRSGQWQHETAWCGQFKDESTGWNEAVLTFDVANTSTIEFGFFYDLQNNVKADPSVYYLIDDLSVTGQ